MSITYNWRWLTGLEQVVGLTLGVVNSATRQANRLAIQTAITDAIADGTNMIFLPSGRIEIEFTNSSTDYRLNVTDDLIVQGCGMDHTVLAYTSSTHFVYYGFQVSGSGGDLTLNDLTLHRIDAGEDPAGGTQGYNSANVNAVNYGIHVPGDLTLNRVKSTGEWTNAFLNTGNVDATMTFNECDLSAWGHIINLFDTGGLSDRRLHITDTYLRSANILADPFTHTIYIHPHVSVKMTRVRWGTLPAGYAIHHFSESGVAAGSAPKYVQYTDCVLEPGVGRGIITPRGGFAEIKGLTSQTPNTAIYAYSSVTVSGSTFWGPAVTPGINFDATDLITSIGNTFLGHQTPYVFGGNVKFRSIGDRFFGTKPAVINTAGGDIQIDDGWWHGQTEHLVSMTNGVATFTLPTHAQAAGTNDLIGTLLTLNEVSYTVASNTTSVVTLTVNYAGSTSAVVKALWPSFQTAVDINGVGGKLRVNRGRLVGTVTNGTGAFYLDSANTSVFEINDTVFELTGDTYNIRTNGAGIVRGRNNTFSGATPLYAGSSGAQYGFIQFNDAVHPTTIASATTIQNLSTHYNVYHVTGTTTINKIMWADSAIHQRMMSGQVTLIADAAWTLNDDSVSSGNVKLRTGSTLVMVAGQTVTLVYDPVTAFWYQI